jgi:cell division septal protein FtsQ
MRNTTMVETALRGETDFLRRENNKIISKQKKIRSIRLKGIHLFFIFFLLLSAAFTAYKIGTFVLTWETLNIKSFELVGNPPFINAELEKILSRFKGGNILTLSFKDLREKLSTIKAVKDVSLSRKLPSTIEIRFMLRDPVYQVESGGRYNVTDSEGVVLYTLAGDRGRDDLITVKDIKAGEFETIAPYLGELKRIENSIQYVGFKKPYGVALKLKGEKEIFYPGEDDYAGKINYYLQLRRRHLQGKYNITCVDLRFKDRFYFEYETEVND